MGVLWRTAKAVVVAAALAAGARAGASVQVEPIARLSLEGGYDSNVLYDGRGYGTGRVSPDLGVHLRDHTYSLLLSAGGDLLTFPERQTSSTVWNQRGAMLLKAHLTDRLTLDTDAKGIYAFDPIGLARIGIFRGPEKGAAFVGGLKARLAWREDHQWTFTGTLEEHAVRFADTTGAASHTPGVEVTRKLDRRLEVGGAYKFDVFQQFGPGTRQAYANEALAVMRWRWTRRLTFEAAGGGAVWQRDTTYVIPQASLQLLGLWRRGDLRLELRHGVGLGVTATPGLFDSVEGGATLRLTASWEVHAEGGLWRSGNPPWGSDAALGYGIEGEVAYRFTRQLRLGLAGSRFARADGASTLFDRNLVGLRMSWELRHR